jgi:hypothetical protein
MASIFTVIATYYSGEVTRAAADFRTLALSVHNPAERLATGTQLLRAHSKARVRKILLFSATESSRKLGVIHVLGKQWGLFVDP